jgi:phosphoribosylamine--glycine ligase
VKVLVVGSGGREHTLAWKLKQSPQVEEVYCAPGNAGTALLGENVPLKDNDVPGLIEFARSAGIGLTMVGPEAPLVIGIVDEFRKQGLRVVGPTKEAAQLEGSKVFTKRFLKRHNIPTAAFDVFDDAAKAESALRSGQFEFPTVVKADGLAAGKGVIISQNLDEALAAISMIMRDRKFGESGNRVLIEEFLLGEEASFMVLTDGKNILPMVPSQDHKAIFDGDLGPNTGGMGAYSVDALLTPELRQEILDGIIVPTVEGMAAQGTPFEGVLYAGLMLTERGPQVLEYNVRFGDPETQAVLPRLKSDLLEAFLAVADGDVTGCELDWSTDAAVCVVIASAGYPGAYEKNKEITGISMAEDDSATVVFHAGSKLDDNRVLTNGGRVLGVTSLASSLESAIMRTYEAVNKIHFEGMYYRRDIAAKGLRKKGIK